MENAFFAFSSSSSDSGRLRIFPDGNTMNVNRQQIDNFSSSDISRVYPVVPQMMTYILNMDCECIQIRQYVYKCHLATTRNHLQWHYVLLCVSLFATYFTQKLLD